MDVGLWLHLLFSSIYLSKSVLVTSELSQKSRSELTEVVLTYNSTRTTSFHKYSNRINLTFVVLLTHNVSENENDCIMAKVMPAIELAINKIQKSNYLSVPVDVTLVSRDTFCSSIFGGIGLYEIYSQWKVINAIFGLSCDYVLAPISRYSGVWEIPVFSSSGRPISFDVKTNQYDTLTRLSGSIPMIKQALRLLMNHFNWTTSAMLLQNVPKHKGNSVCYFCMAGLQFHVDNTEFIEIDRTNATKHLISISKKARVIIMCADPQSIRKIMLVAEELKMIDSGEYVFINIELFSRVPQGTAQPWYNKNDTDSNNERAKKAYTALLTVSPKQPDDHEYLKFSEEIKQIAAEKYNYTFDPDESLSTFVTSFYDAVLLYATALNDSITEDPTMLTRPINGTDIVRRMWNRQFQGITGNITIDANGDRVTTYSLLDMNPTTGRFEIVANFLQNRLEYIEGKSIHWAGGRTDAPPDKPLCGFDGSLCPSLPGYAILSLILGFIVVAMTIGSFFGYRHFKSEAEINSMTWRVYYHEVIPCDINERHRGAGGGSMHSLGGKRSGSQLTIYSEDIVSLAGDRQLFIPLGLYKGSKVAIKNINESNITLNRPLMLELKRMKDIQNDHLVKFFGACVDPPKCFLLTDYCPKGSLQDILENEQITLDWMFKLSLMHDIVKGMHFLHCSEIKSHGNLKSSNCVVDSRFVLKITDFGLHQLRKLDINDDEENCNSYAYWKKLLWTAPELLRMENRLPEGTTKGDVYSFGIIVHEIITRQGPFYLGPDEKSPQEIIELVKGYSNRPQSIPFRPHIDEDSENFCDINEIMIKCWSEEAFDRPDFSYLKSTIRKINKDNETGNIVDNLLKRMEQYANNLEGLVDERTQKYLEEKRKYEELLYKLLPQSVAGQLILKQVVMAESFDQVTIYFSDIVGFTAISAESTPMEVVEFLNDLYTEFDKIVENYDVYKVETIGDAYMVVSGLPIRNGNLHSQEIARLALSLLNAVYRFKIRHRPNDQLKLRIGLHSGPCVAGVVGKKMPRYCLFGDTVNTASRMESNGEALKIHISQTTKTYLDQFGTFIMKERGLVAMKGKGDMRTYWLEGEIKLPPTMITNNLLNGNSGGDRSRTNSLRRNNYNKDLSKSQLSISKKQTNPQQQQNNNILPKSPLANQQQILLSSSTAGQHSRSQSPTLLTHYNDNNSNNDHKMNIGDNNDDSNQKKTEQQNSSIYNQNSTPKMVVSNNSSITNNSNNDTNSQNLIQNINNDNNDDIDVIIDDNKLPNKLLYNNINNSDLISDNLMINNDIDVDDDDNLKLNINNDNFTDDDNEIHHNLINKHNNSNNIVVVNNFNNIIKSNNLKNLKCNSTNNSNNSSSSSSKNLMTTMSTNSSNNSDDNLNNKSVTQPLLTKINS